MEEVWERKIEVQGSLYTIFFSRRPFREGLEVSFEHHGESVTWSEQGYGETTVLERVRDFIIKADQGT